MVDKEQKGALPGLLWTSIGFETRRGVLAGAEGCIRPDKQSGVANPEPGLSHLNLDFLCVDQYDIFTRLDT